MDIIVRKDADSAADLVAKLTAKAINEKPALTLGLATGRTMEIVYDKIVALHKAGKVDFSKASSFNLDEYVGLAPEDENSYRSYMNKFLFDRVNINKSKTHIPNGLAADVKAECLRYEKAIAKCGGIDFQLLGIGMNGHIGFNEPMSSFSSLTSAKSLNKATIEVNEKLFPKPEMMPKRAITMGVKTILNTRKAVLLATGDSKADIIAKAIEGPMAASVTASALQMHENCVVVLDEAAAKNLKMRDYYDWVFQSEPDWAEFR
jgi:glucosamine-6-phosphate deaminase